MRNYLLLIICLLTFNHLSAQINNNLDYSDNREYEIAAITVSGANLLDETAIVSLSGLRVGDKINIPGEAISSAIRRLWSRGILGDVKISVSRTDGDKVYLNIDIQERPKLTRFYFRGVRKGEGQTLAEQIDLIRGKVITPAILKNTQNSIEKFFTEKGFYNVSVSIVQVQDTLVSTGGTILNIKVDKGKKVKIKKLDIVGNEEISDKKLAKKIKTKQKKGSRLLVRSKYIRSRFEEDKEKLIRYYRSNGYRDARVIGDSIYGVNDKLINLQLRIEEGQRYYFRNITWKGNYVYNDETLARVLGIKKGDVYDLENLEQRLNFSQTDLDITSLYMDDGYLFFSIQPVEVAVNGDSVDIQMQIYEGAQANINKIILSGNTKTNDRVVLREIRTVPGQKFSRSALIRSQREIATLGYFDPEQIGINPLPNIQDGTVDIEYTVVEKPSDQIELSGGWGGAFGFVGTVGLVFNNFSLRKLFKFGDWGGVLPSGDGQRVALRVQANGRRFQNYSLSFTEPWLGGRKPNAFSLILSHAVQRRFDNFNLAIADETGSLRVTEVTLSLGRRLRWPDNFFSLRNSVSFRRYRLRNFATGLRDFDNGDSYNITFNTVLARNSIDNPTYPRRGSNLSISMSLTPPYSLFQNRNFAELSNEERFNLIEYHKWIVDNVWYTQLVGDLVLSTRTHFGFIAAYNSELGVGPFERFILGGAGLTGQNFLLGNEIIGLRGYDDNSIAPPSEFGQTGGVAFTKFVMELRYPISLNPAATVFIVSFLEGGNNFADFSQYNPFDLKRSAGIGARIFMPAFGLIGLDWGYGFDDIPDRPSANGGRFHFTIGQQIR